LQSKVTNLDLWETKRENKIIIIIINNETMIKKNNAQNVFDGN